MLLKLKIFLMLVYICGFLLQAFIALPFLAEIRAASAILLLGLNFSGLKPLNRNLVMMLLLASSLLLANGVNGFNWARAVNENAGIVTLLLTVPMLATILAYAPYERVITELVQKYIRSEYSFYAVILLMVNLLGTIMALAALPFVYHIIRPVAADYPGEMIHKALTRGFCGNLFWSPNFVTVAVVLQYIPITWYQLMPVGIGFSLLSALLALLQEKAVLLLRWSNAASIPAAGHGSARLTAEHKKYLALLGLQITLILGVVLLLDSVLHKNVFVTIPLVALAVPFIIAVLSGRKDIYKTRFNEYLTKVLPGMGNELILFAALGFFGYTLGRSPVSKMLPDLIFKNTAFSPESLITAIIAVIAALAVIGIHPTITIATLAITLSGIKAPLSDLQLAMTLITGYVMYLIWSPFSSMALLMSGLVQQPVLNVSFRINAGYGVLLALTGALVIRWLL